MKLRLILTAATCLGLPLAAHAQPVTGPYVSLGAGVNIKNPVNNDTGQNNYIYGGVFGSGSGSYSEDDPSKTLFRAGLASEFSAGYGFGNGFRVELSGDFDRNTLYKSDFTGAETYDGGSYNGSPYSYRASGRDETYGVMLNGLYDFDVGLPIFPYVGAGVGYQWTSYKSHQYYASEGVYGTLSGTPGSVAYDVIAGLAYPLPMVPGLSVTAEYRFMQLVESRKITGVESYNYGDRYETGSETWKEKIGQESSHSFLIGLRYQLFAPPPPPPAPVAAPPPVANAPSAPVAQTYLVFFDWDKYDLSPRATQIISQAAAGSKTNSTTTLDVSGYTDTSGTAGYNMGLSERRAKAVAAQLVADGVPASEIEIHAFGETHLLVPTGPGVREPQNRRVEIVLK